MTRTLNQGDAVMLAHACAVAAYAHTMGAADAQDGDIEPVAWMRAGKPWEDEAEIEGHIAELARYVRKSTPQPETLYIYARLSGIVPAITGDWPDAPLATRVAYRLFVVTLVACDQLVAEDAARNAARDQAAKPAGVHTPPKDDSIFTKHDKPGAQDPDHVKAVEADKAHRLALAIEKAADHIDSLQLPERVHNALKGAKLTSVSQLQVMTDEDLLAVPNFGAAALKVLRKALNARGKAENPATPMENPLAGAKPAA